MLIAVLLAFVLGFIIGVRAVAGRPPSPPPKALVFRSFDIPEAFQTAGAMDVVPRATAAPTPSPSPSPRAKATPWPTHPPQPKLAGGPYKPWRKFSANVLQARIWLKDRLSRTSFRCIDVLWDRESGWRVHAGNKTSGAYGIPQALPGSKMAWAGDDWRDNATTQVRWGLHYIQGRYGNPCIALDHSYRTGWY